MSEVKETPASELRAGDKVVCILAKGYQFFGQRGTVLSIDGVTKRALIRWAYSNGNCACRNHDLAELGVVFCFEQKGDLL